MLLVVTCLEHPTLPNPEVALNDGGSAVSHYRSNVRDQVLTCSKCWASTALGHGEFSDVDVDTARDMLAEVSRPG